MDRIPFQTPLPIERSSRGHPSRRHDSRSCLRQSPWRRPSHIPCRRQNRRPVRDQHAAEQDGMFVTPLVERILDPLVDKDLGRPGLQ